MILQLTTLRILPSGRIGEREEIEREEREREKLEREREREREQTNYQGEKIQQCETGSSS